MISKELDSFLDELGETHEMYKRWEKRYKLLSSRIKNIAFTTENNYFEGTNYSAIITFSKKYEFPEYITQIEKIIEDLEKQVNILKEKAKSNDEVKVSIDEEKSRLVIKKP